MALDRDKQLILGNGQAGAPVGLVNMGGIGLTTTTLATGQSPLYTELAEYAKRIGLPPINPAEPVVLPKRVPS